MEEKHLFFYYKCIATEHLINYLYQDLTINALGHFKQACQRLQERDLQALTPQTNHQTKITPKIYQETLERGKEAMSDLTEMVDFTTYIEKLH